LKSGVDGSSLLNQHGFTGYKIGAAKYHLLKARETYPRMPLYPNPPPEVVDFLFNIDAFFYSAWSALDFLSREINSTYFLGLEDPKLKLSSVRKSLRDIRPDDPITKLLNR